VQNTTGNETLIEIPERMRRKSIHIYIVKYIVDWVESGACNRIHSGRIGDFDRFWANLSKRAQTAFKIRGAVDFRGQTV
jgi:hypothetical protein